MKTCQTHVGVSPEKARFFATGSEIFSGGGASLGHFCLHEAFASRLLCKSNENMLKYRT